MNDLDAVKRIAGMRDVALVLIPFVKGAEVDDYVLAQCIIGRPKGRRSLFGVTDAQVERCSVGGVHGERNAWVIDGAIPETRGGDAGRRRIFGRLVGSVRDALERLERDGVARNDPLGLQTSSARSMSITT